MSAWSLPLLPTNGLDRSLHAPVLVGLLFVSLFTEAFGWTYAGLVVPGYLAATFAAAPITAILVLVEGWLTHVGVASIARIVPERTGAWSTSFGRERFFLYIVVAIVIRLFVEGTVVPWVTLRYGLTHSRELYSIGLVLVPLVANVFWSSGIFHAGPRLLVLSGLTYLVVDQLLLRHTNFSLSRFQVANESVALHFLDTPKAYLLLLVGAMLGARGNVQYGWDYNGILVPALLAVAWYEPLKLVGTAVECVALYLLARFLSSVRPFSRLALVGPRRMVFVGILGFIVKLLIGHVLVRTLPKLQLTEYLGFGYILPSLLAVKMWNKLRIGIVLMPTLQVSLTAFIVGNALGFGLNWATQSGPSSQRAVQTPTEVESVALTWLLSSHGLVPRPGECEGKTDLRAVTRVIDSTLRLGYPDASALASLDEYHLQAVTDRGRWWLIVPKPDGNPPCTNVRLALSPEHWHKGGTLAILTPRTPFGSPTVITALALAEATQAPLIAMTEGAAGLDDQLVDLIGRLSPSPSLLALSIHGTEANRITVAGALPPTVNVGAMERLTGAPIALVFVASEPTSRPTLRLSAAANQRISTRYLGPASIEHWPGSLHRNIQDRIDDLVGQSYRAPLRAELLLLSATVLPALETPEPPSDWVLVVARELGYSLAEVNGGLDTTWILFEPPSDRRRGNATWMVRPAASRDLTLEVPAPRWELGTLSYGIGLFSLLDARHLLVAGAKPDARADGSSDPRRTAGRNSYFQRIHESALARGSNVVAIHGIRPDVSIPDDVIAEAAIPVLAGDQRSRLAIEISEALAPVGLHTGFYSAGLSHVSIGAQFDPAFAFAERFAPEQMLRLWFSQGAREQVATVPPSLDAFKRIVDRSPMEADLAEIARLRFETFGRPRVNAPITNACQLDSVVEAIGQWLTRNNPFDRLDAKRLGRECSWFAAIDAPTGIPWLVLLSPLEGRLVPLHNAKATESRIDAGRSPSDWRTALNLGLATVRLEAP